jgi:hypothetical protein
MLSVMDFNDYLGFWTYFTALIRLFKTFLVAGFDLFLVENETSVNCLAVVHLSEMDLFFSFNYLVGYFRHLLIF